MHAEALCSPLLSQAGFRHAFFTRSGGVSEGPYASLNFSVAVGDAPENVRENLERARASLGVTRSALLFASQVHGKDVRRVGASDVLERVLECQADALVTFEPGIACAVRTADCVPILLADRRSGAVAAVHAGWRGVVAEVVAAALSDLRASAASDVIAAIGPHISVPRFEVSDEVADQIQAAVPGADVIDRTLSARGRPHVDLRRGVRSQLERLGVLPEHIDDVLGCTESEPRRFFSYRRDGARSGRHLSAIVARNSI